MATPNNMEKAYTYIVQCSDGSFYCGWALNVEDRVKVHNEGKGSKYVAKRLPAKVVYFEEFDTRAKAAQREYQIKCLKRQDKIQLIQSKHPEYQPLPLVKIIV